VVWGNATDDSDAVVWGNSDLDPLAADRAPAVEPAAVPAPHQRSTATAVR
jgi:hypothetical protein